MWIIDDIKISRERLQTHKINYAERRKLMRKTKNRMGTISKWISEEKGKINLRLQKDDTGLWHIINSKL